MLSCNTLIRNAIVFDGSGASSQVRDVAIGGDRISAIGSDLECHSANIVEAQGLVLAPGFIDVHTHDDIRVISNPDLLPKLSQGVTTVVVGNCGISAAPVTLRGDPPDPMNLLGNADEFRYPNFNAYVAAIEREQPAVNVGALVGHTSLRNNCMDRLDRAATAVEIEAMEAQLQEALDAGALGLSSGLAYLAAQAAPTSEILALARHLEPAGGIYVTHMRSETDAILDAMREACRIGRQSHVPTVISHLKCAGVDNWGRSEEVLKAFDNARLAQPVGCDCYPYAAGSSTLDIRQVDERVEITITWSSPHPDRAGQSLKQIAAGWHTTQLEAAKRLQPAGAIYHSLCEDDMRRILRHPATMIGSDGLPHDPRPHPRLWGAFPRVLGRYCREERLFSLPQAIHKMTGLPAGRFGLLQRGLIREGYYADLTLFDSETILDRATYAEPQQPSVGIHGVWVNGRLSYTQQGSTGERRGHFLPRGKVSWGEEAEWRYG